ncbi:MAG: lipopolysaccharide biosynthesis protein [Coriobacteriales bacterium]|jgi:O-antigen/teichoic acid export membrane protein|nr:lipopolysaccharide biosynthesis protein [Coriobacteriales bacterium]
MSESSIQRSAYFWNTVSGVLAAFQSVIWLVVITRVCDLMVAGVFTIAFALANQFLNIGKFGMRNFQASDVVTAGTEPRYSFGDYLLSRILSSLAMIVCAVAYVVWASFSLDYGLNKTLVVLLMCLLKVTDAIEDIYHGNYQQYGRLDVAGRLMTIRTAVTILILGICIAFTHDLVVSLAITLVTSSLLLVGLILFAQNVHRLPAGKRTHNWNETLHLLKDCIPLFLMSFLIFYIGNTPRYAIDAYAGDVAQAIYGFIAMPVFVVALFASFVYAPIIAPLSHLWRERKIGAFLRQFALQVLWVVLITIGCVIAALFAGVPVLSWLYDTDVSDYLLELCVLVAGGGFLALGTLFSLGATILRRQSLMIGSYGVVSILAFFCSTYAVRQWDILGASWAYFFLMGLLAFGTFLTFAFCVRTAKSTDNENEREQTEP